LQSHEAAGFQPKRQQCGLFDLVYQSLMFPGRQ
jgi:hypothetical protein